MARGALTVEHIIDQRKLLALYAVGLLYEIEPFDRESHPDALNSNGQRNEDIAVKDVWYSQRGKPEYK